IGFNRFLHKLTHECNDGAGIYPTAEKGTERDITHQVELDALPKQGLEFFRIGFFTIAGVPMVSERQIPVTAELDTIDVASKAATRRQGTDSLKHSLRCRHVPQR